MGLRLNGPSRASGRERGKRRLLLYAGTLACVVLTWTLLVFALGVGSGAGSPSARPVGGELGDGDGSGETPVAGAPQAARERGEAVSEADGGERDHVTPEDHERFVERERRRDREAQEERFLPPGGVRSEPGGYDPLGIGNQPVPLTLADQDRVEAVAGRFVTAAYGYSGGRGSRRAYLSGVNDAVLSPEFYSSAGAEEVRRYSDLVEKSGTRSAARMSRFDVQTAGQDRVAGHAYFSTADLYDRYGNLRGRERSYRQELALVRHGATFKVRAAGEVQEVRRR